MRALQHAGSVARDRGDDALALSRYQESVVLARDSGDERIVVAALVGIATITAMIGTPDRATRLFGAISALQERLDSPTVSLPLDRAAHERAMAKSWAALGDVEAAAAWEAGQALSKEHAITEGLAPVEQRPRAAKHGLTERELDVLRLLVVGRSDREIAQTLFISRRTVQGHVAHIFAKLGVNSRTAATTAALAAGVVSTLPTSPVHQS